MANPYTILPPRSSGPEWDDYQEIRHNLTSGGVRHPIQFVSGLFVMQCMFIIAAVLANLRIGAVTILTRTQMEWAAYVTRSITATPMGPYRFVRSTEAPSEAQFMVGLALNSRRYWLLEPRPPKLTIRHLGGL